MLRAVRRAATLFLTGFLWHFRSVLYPAGISILWAMDDPLSTQYFIVSGDTYCKQLSNAWSGAWSGRVTSEGATWAALLCKAEGCNCFKNLRSGIRTNSTDTVADLFTSSSSLLNDCRSNQIEPIAQRSTLLNYLSHSSAMAKSNESAILTTLLWRPGKIPIFEHLILRFNTFLYCFNFCIFQLVVYKA